MTSNKVFSFFHKTSVFFPNSDIIARILSYLNVMYKWFPTFNFTLNLRKTKKVILATVADQIIFIFRDFLNLFMRRLYLKTDIF